MQEGQKILNRGLADRLLVPAGITDLALYTRIKSANISILLGLVMTWAIISYSRIPSAIEVGIYFQCGSILAYLCNRSGLHKVGRPMFVFITDLSWLFWSSLLGLHSFIWLFPIMALAGSFLSESRTDSRYEKIFLWGTRFMDSAVVLSTVSVAAFHFLPTTYDADAIGRIEVIGIVIVLYSTSMLFKSLLMYRRELTLSKGLVEKQAVMMIQHAKMSSLGEMAGGVAHEINNPLAMILGHSTHLVREIKSGNTSAEQLLPKAEKIESTVARISKIVNSLRTFARNADEDPFRVAQLASILSETTSFCRENLQKQQIELRLTGNQELSLSCRETQISQVLISLITNSLYAVRDLSEKWIEIHCAETPGQIILRVTDSGRGISSDIADKIMQPFFTTKEIGSGTGLGLSIAKGIIDSHYGSISLDRNCSNTRFVITLPIHQQVLQPRAA